MSELLIDESPVLVIPSLAVKIGLNEAMVLQQIHYWAKKKKTAREGFYWVYNSYEAWQEQFPFFSKSTIGRTIRSLEKLDLLITGNFNKLSFDKTKWYRINYNKLDEYKDKDGEKGFKTPLNQDESSNVSNWNDDGVKLASSVVSERTNNTIDYPKTTTENNIKDNVDLIKIDHAASKSTKDKYKEQRAEIIDYLNKQAKKKYRTSTKATAKHINARLAEGFTVDDFKRVIDIKVSQWLNDDRMNAYLRPETLFSGKFESYLNEQPKKAFKGATNDYDRKREQSNTEQPKTPHTGDIIFTAMYKYAFNNGISQRDAKAQFKDAENLFKFKSMKIDGYENVQPITVDGYTLSMLCSVIAEFIKNEFADNGNKPSEKYQALINEYIEQLV